MKLGLAGPPGSGKDFVASYFVGRHSFVHISTGDLLRSEASKRGMGHERETLQRLGARIRHETGHDPLLDNALKQFVGRVVFTGIRTMDAAQRIVSAGSLIYVDAPIGVRYDRSLRRGRGTESEASFEDFKRADLIEHNGSEEADMALNRIKPLARFIVENAGSANELIERLDGISESLGLITD